MRHNEYISTINIIIFFPSVNPPLLGLHEHARHHLVKNTNVRLEQ